MQLMSDSKLQILTERTWDLHTRISERIHQNQNGYSFCSHCSNHGRYSVVADNTVEERETLIGIKNSLRDVYNNLVLLQGEKSWQKPRRDEILSRLDGSRELLIEKLHQCSEKLRRLDLIKELMTFLGDGKTGFSINYKDGKKRLNGISKFLVNTTRFLFEFAIMYVTIYSTVTLYNNNHKQKNDRLKREIVAPVDTTIVTRKVEFLVTDSNVPLDVFSGRG